MNEIVNKFLLVGDKFMPEIHLKQPGFTYSACGPFTKHAERIKKFRETGDTRYIYKNELDKACFRHDSAYADNKDLINRTKADKVLSDKSYEIASDNKYDGCQRGLAGMVYKFFYKKTIGSGVRKVNRKKVGVISESSARLADELHKPVIKKFNRRKVYSSFKDNIWGVDLADMRLLSRRNKGIKYLLCAIDLFSKFAFVVPLKDKRGVSIVKGFEEIIDDSSREPNKIWVDQGGEFYNKVFKNWFNDKGTEMYSTYNEDKSVVAERFIRTLKNKLYKHVTSIGKDVYYDILDDVVKKYNNTVNRSIGMKPKDVSSSNNESTYVEESNKKDAKFSVGDRVRISKFKNIFAKGYTANWSKEISVISKIKNTLPWTYELKDLNGENIIGSFYERESQKTKF